MWLQLAPVSSLLSSLSPSPSPAWFLFPSPCFPGLQLQSRAIMKKEGVKPQGDRTSKSHTEALCMPVLGLHPRSAVPDPEPHPHQLSHTESHTHSRTFIDWKVHTSTGDGTNATLPTGGKLSERPTTPLIPHSSLRSHTHTHMHTVPHTHTLWLCFCVLSELMRKVPVPCG